MIRCFTPRGIAALLTLTVSLVQTRGQTAAPVELEALEVIASPIVDESTVDGFASQTTVIGRKQIEALNAGDAASALRRTPGVAITRYNAVGSFGGGEGGAILIRGLGSSRPGGEIKTLVDGVPNYNAVFNHPLLDLMSIDMAARVEVKRSANPVAAGNLFAGINLVTPRTTTPGASANVMLMAGSFGAWAEKVEGGYKTDGFDIYAGQSHREAEGHRPDSDGELNNYLVQLGWQPVAHWDFTYVLNRTDNRATDPGPETGAGLPPTRGDVYLTENWLHILTAAWDTERVAGELKAYLNEGEATWLRRTTSNNADSLNDYRLSGMRWHETLRLIENNEIVVGADYDLMRGTTVAVPPGAAPKVTFGPEEFALVSAYAGVNHTWKNGGLTITPSAGLRYYDHEIFGSETAVQAGVVAQAGRSQWRVSAGRAVNFPGLDVAAFSVVAIPALGQSWRSLHAEKLDQYELGWRGDFANHTSMAVTLFRNEGRDRYVFVPPPPPPFKYLNLEEFRTQGAEVTVTLHPRETLSLFGGVSYLETTPDDLPYAPEWSLVGGATWRLFDKLTLNLDASYLSSQSAGAQARANSAPNLERINAFALINARLAWALGTHGEKGEVFAAGENLLDRDYRYRPGYPMPGIGGSVGLKLKF
jgi:outer membrane receptor protein involved in Fe transport